MKKEARELKGLLFSQDKEKGLIVEEVSLKDTLEDYYRLLKCSLIDIQVRKISGREYDFIFDEEFLYSGHEPTEITGVEISYNQETILGNLLILGLADSEGRETSLTDNDIELIKTQLIGITTPKGILKALKYTY